MTEVPTIYQVLEAEGVTPYDSVDDDIADLAFIFGGDLNFWADKSLWELAQWRKRALDRYQAANGTGES